MRKWKNESGFTLLEVAMVLIVASLIVLATIKAQGIWNEAKLFRMMRQVQEVQVASALFNNTMGYLPGANATDPTQITNTPLNKDWNVDLADQNLVVSASKAQTHPFLGRFWMDYYLSATNPHSADINLITLESVPSAFARALDELLDDGAPGTGTVRATPDLATASPTADYTTGAIRTLWIRID